jgi:hypothetical protein
MHYLDGDEVMNDEKIAKLEQEVYDLKVRTSVNETNIKSVTDDVKEIKNNTSKMVWLVGSALILTLLNLIMKGGVFN